MAAGPDHLFDVDELLARGILAGAATVFWWQGRRGSSGGAGKSSGSSGKARKGADTARKFEVIRGGRDADPMKWN